MKEKILKLLTLALLATTLAGCNDNPTTSEPIPESETSEVSEPGSESEPESEGESEPESEGESEPGSESESEPESETQSIEEVAFARYNELLAAAASAYNATYGISIPNETGLLGLEASGMTDIRQISVNEATDYLDYIGFYNIYMVVSFLDGVDIEAQAALYNAALEASDAWAYTYCSATGYGYYNASTHEFAVVDATTSSVWIDVYVGGESYFFPLLSTEEEARAIINAKYAELVATYPDYFSASSTALPGFDANGLSGYSSIVAYYTDRYIDTEYNQYIYYVSYMFSYDDVSNAETMVSEYIAALEASSDWVYSYCSYLYGYGYYNASTGEFALVYTISVGVDIDVYVMPSLGSTFASAGWLGSSTVDIDGTSHTVSLSDDGTGSLDGGSSFYYDIAINSDGSVTITFTSDSVDYSLTYDPSTGTLSQSVEVNNVFDNETDAWAYFNSLYSAMSADSFYGEYLPATATALPTLASASVATPSSITVNESQDYINNAIYLMEVVVSFADGVDASAQSDLYLAALGADEAWVYSNNEDILSMVFTLDSYYGYFNSTTGEFVMVSASDGNLVITVYEMPLYADYITAVTE